MIEKLYKIKPLKWGLHTGCARTCHGVFTITHSFCDGYALRYESFDERRFPYTMPNPCFDLEYIKTCAESLHLNRLLSDLE